MSLQYTVYVYSILKAHKTSNNLEPQREQRLVSILTVKDKLASYAQPFKVLASPHAFQPSVRREEY